MESGIGKCIDRISSLPDCLLCHILSLLGTKNAVGTSILAKRWKDLWVYIPNLDFDDSEMFGSFSGDELDLMGKRFVIFVSRVLLRSRALCLQKFHLDISSDEAIDFADLWINIAITRNVQNFMLRNLCEDNVLLPPRLFSSQTLEILILSGVIFEVPDLVCLPSLKIANICYVEDGDGDSLQRFLAGCPVLEDLYVRRKDFGDLEDFVVSVPTLKRLGVECYGDDLEYVYPNQYAEVVLNAPKLEYLNISDYYFDDFCFKNLSSLAKAYIEVGRTSLRPDSFSDEGLPIYKLLSGISNVKVLHANFFFHIDVNNYKLPTFRNLTKLALGGDGYSSWWNLKLVADFLQCSPNLEVLILEERRHSSWKAPEQVPDCLVSRLKTVKIDKCTGEDYELRVIEYFLKNAKVLEKMEVDCSDANDHFSKTVTSFPRESSICRLHLFQ